MENQKKFSISESIKTGTNLVLKNYIFWIIFFLKTIGYEIIAFILILLFSAGLFSINYMSFYLILKKNFIRSGIFISSNILIILIMLLLIAYLISIISANYYNAALNFYDNKEQPPFLKLNKTCKFLGCNILKSFIISIGLACFIIPGLYLIARLSFSTLFIVDTNCGILDAFKKSWRLTASIAFECFALWICKKLLQLLGGLFFIISFATTPIFSQIYVAAYKELQKNNYN